MCEPVNSSGKRGSIINIASLISFQGGLNIPAYAAAKGGIVTLTRALANEWASKAISVNAIAPGYVETDMNVELRKDEERMKELQARIPAARWGKPEDFQGPVVFLASAASAYVSGEVLMVVGTHTCLLSSVVEMDWTRHHFIKLLAKGSSPKVPPQRFLPLACQPQTGLAGGCRRRMRGFGSSSAPLAREVWHEDEMSRESRSRVKSLSASWTTNSVGVPPIPTVAHEYHYTSMNLTATLPCKIAPPPPSGRQA